jgi:uncharacterized protein YprB with RNaseH-like and TPR domain
LRPARYFVEELMSGEVVHTLRRALRNREAVRAPPAARQHGYIEPARAAGGPAGFTLGRRHRSSHPTKWAFLDTETTGLAGGTGTYAFLIGVGSIEPAGFRLRQFFMRDHGEEASLLRQAFRAPGAVRRADHLQRQDLRPAAARDPLPHGAARHPFERLAHLDLLFGARRLWKLRLESCRLVDLENRILGVERQGDLPGEMIPYYYFEYLRTQQAFRLVPVFHHNAIDILSLACLTAIVPFAFRSPEETAFRHGADVIGLARWVLQSGRHGEALRLLPARGGPGAAGRSAVPHAVGHRRTGEAPGPRGCRAGAVHGPGRVAQRVSGARVCGNWRCIMSTASATTPWRWR